MRYNIDEDGDQVMELHAIDTETGTAAHTANGEIARGMNLLPTMADALRQRVDALASQSDVAAQPRRRGWTLGLPRRWNLPQPRRWRVTRPRTWTVRRFETTATMVPVEVERGC